MVGCIHSGDVEIGGAGIANVGMGLDNSSLTFTSVEWTVISASSIPLVDCRRDELSSSEVVTPARSTGL